MSILIFILVLFVLILVHELGHFLVAKWVGMRVDEFGIGFPPKLFGIKKGETEYTFNLFPIGGFVRIYGEDAWDTSARLDENSSEQREGKSPSSGQHRYDEDGTNVPSSPVRSEAEDRRSEALAEVGEGGEDSVGVEGEQNRAFVGKGKWAQAAVLVAGVTANVLLAWILFTGALAVGIQTPVTEEEATENATLYITDVMSGSPAESAGLVPGTEIVGVGLDETSLVAVSGPSAFAETVSGTDGDVFVQHMQNGEVVTSRITPEAGLLEEDSERAVIGVALGLAEVVSRPLHVAVWEAGVMTVQGLRDVTIGLGTLLYGAVTFTADFSQVAGPVGIVSLVGEASAFGVTTLIMFTAFISLNLAVINLFPFPALDGGRLLFVAIEAVKGSPIKASLASGLNTLGFALLILLMVAITYNDIVRLF